MHFKSDEPAETVPWEEAPIAFYDVEVFPNLFLVNYKVAGDGKKVIRMINPKPAEIEQMITHYRLVGFNNRDYDNHILLLFCIKENAQHEGIGVSSKTYTGN